MNHLRANQRTAFKVCHDAGLSVQTCKVVAANLTGEALAKPWDRHWDVKHYSQGIAQWDQNRAERIRAHFGKYPKDMTVAEQTEAFLWECKMHYPKTWAALHNNILSPMKQLEIIIRDFERPRDPIKAAKSRLRFYVSLEGIENERTA